MLAAVIQRKPNGPDYPGKVSLQLQFVVRLLLVPRVSKGAARDKEAVVGRIELLVMFCVHPSLLLPGCPMAAGRYHSFLRGMGRLA